MSGDAAEGEKKEKSGSQMKVQLFMGSFVLEVTSSSLGLCDIL